MSAIQVVRATGLDPDTVGVYALNAAGVYSALGTRNPFHNNFYSVTSTFVIDGTNAVKTWAPVSKPLAEVRTIAKLMAKRESNNFIKRSLNESGYDSFLILAAASKLAADRGADVQSAITPVQTLLTSFDSLLTSIDNATTVPQIETAYMLTYPESYEFGYSYAVTVSGGDYYLNGDQYPAVDLIAGLEYTFIQDDSSNSGHPLRIYEDASKTKEITAGVTVVGTPGTAGSYTRFIPYANGTFSYQCSSHAGMGGSITVSGAGIEY